MNGVAEAVKSATAAVPGFGSVEPMADPLHSLIALASEREARDEFRSDPAAWRDACDTDLTGEDVVAAAAVVAVQMPPDVAGRIRGATGAMIDAVWTAPTPSEGALAAVDVLCDALDEGTVAELPRREPAPDPSLVPDRPPGATRPPHLWAVGASGAAGTEPAADGGSPPGALAPVPAPDEGYRYHVLELVSLPEGIADAGIEPGASATVVATHPGPPLSYEVEVSNDDGSRRFLGLVPADAVAPLRA